jgi:hypothetical protein
VISRVHVLQVSRPTNVTRNDDAVTAMLLAAGVDVANLCASARARVCAISHTSRFKLHSGKTPLPSAPIAAPGTTSATPATPEMRLIDERKLADMSRVRLYVLRDLSADNAPSPSASKRASMAAQALGDNVDMTAVATVSVCVSVCMCVRASFAFVHVLFAHVW